MITFLKETLEMIAWAIVCIVMYAIGFLAMTGALTVMSL